MSATTARRRARAAGRLLGLALVGAIALVGAQSAVGAAEPESQAQSPDGPVIAGAAVVAPATWSAFGERGVRVLLRRAQPQFPDPGPPLVVQRVIAAADEIATMPYHYGGGHGNWNDSGYDCSGSVSYALHGGGLLAVSQSSSGFIGWGDPGPGRWITIYASPGHAFMVVNGRRFDTTGREQTGSRWQAAGRDASGYVVRHPPGL